jgi:hypothetical protein
LILEINIGKNCLFFFDITFPSPQTYG